ncbi:MAG: hypothetical protein ACRC5M_06605, partial [Anaeroplasmataceae bacterium]
MKKIILIFISIIFIITLASCSKDANKDTDKDMTQNTLIIEDLDGEIVYNKNGELTNLLEEVSVDIINTIDESSKIVTTPLLYNEINFDIVLMNKDDNKYLIKHLPKEGIPSYEIGLDRVLYKYVKSQIRSIEHTNSFLEADFWDKSLLLKLKENGIYSDLINNALKDKDTKYLDKSEQQLDELTNYPTVSNGLANFYKYYTHASLFNYDMTNLTNSISNRYYTLSNHDEDFYRYYTSMTPFYLSTIKYLGLDKT